MPRWRRHFFSIVHVCEKLNVHSFYSIRNQLGWAILQRLNVVVATKEKACSLKQVGKDKSTIQSIVVVGICRYDVWKDANAKAKGKEQKSHKQADDSQPAPWRSTWCTEVHGKVDKSYQRYKWENAPGDQERKQRDIRQSTFESSYCHCYGYIILMVGVVVQTLFWHISPFLHLHHTHRLAWG